VPQSQNARLSERDRQIEPVLDVVIVTYNNAMTIANCLEAASRIAGLGKIVVVDHGEDESAKIAAAFDVTVVRDPTNPGFGQGQNRGRTLTSAEFLLILNPDAVIEPAAVEGGLKTLRDKPSVAAVQGVIFDSGSGEPERSAGRELSPLHLWGRALGIRRLRHFGPARAIARRIPALADHVERQPEAETVVNSLGATALLIRREALEDVGGFDARYFMYGEDVDLCTRLRRHGWELHALASNWASHRAGSSSRTAVGKEILWWQGTMTFAARWYSSTAWTLALVACTIRVLTLSVLHPRSAREAFGNALMQPFSKRQQDSRLLSPGGRHHG
jgi:N-acetylglucosaminyl-diphospho-decaprenol L-rhamnosyltransferase